METLFAVVTISEAARMWNKHPLTVRRALDSLRLPLQFRQSGATYLITVDSLTKRWGKPQQPPSY